MEYMSKGGFVMIFVLSLLISTLLFAKEPGQVVFENSCQRCHTEGSKKPLSYLREKYKGKPEAITQMAKVCPWGKGLSDMEING